MIFEIKKGSFGYYKSKIILKSIDLEVKSGNILSILGANGAGKTTLLQCIMGLLKWNSGDGYINNQSISKMKFGDVWQNIGYVPQAKIAHNFTVLEMVVFGRSSHISVFNMPSKSDYDLAMVKLEEVGMSLFADRLCSTLSGGELQMVLIARALAANPQILILDEPESNLDFKNQLKVLNIIEQLAQSGIICIFNTHYPTHALRISSHTLLLDKLGNSTFGATPHILTAPNISRAFEVQAHISSVNIAGNDYPQVICY